MDCFLNCPIQDKAQQDAVIDTAIRASFLRGYPKTPLSLWRLLKSHARRLSGKKPAQSAQASQYVFVDIGASIIVLLQVMEELNRSSLRR